METKERARANTPGLSRRSLLAAAPALALVGAVPAEATPADTPVMALFREWRAQHQLMESLSETISDDDYVEMGSVRGEIEDRLFAEPAQDCRDVCLKLLALSLDGVDFMDDGHQTGLKIVKEARALIGA